MLPSYDEIMHRAVEDTLEEMYLHSYPAISRKQVIKDAEEGKKVDLDLISHHYIPAELYESIKNEAERVYSYEKFFEIYTSDFADFLIKGGRAKDIVSGGRDDWKDYTSIKDVIGEDAFNSLKNYIEAYKSTFRFDWKRWGFNFAIANYSPSINREKVLEYWKSKGVDLEIPSDQEIIDAYYDYYPGDEYEDEE